jgi:hypothetical protein
VIASASSASERASSRSGLISPTTLAQEEHPRELMLLARDP